MVEADDFVVIIFISIFFYQLRYTGHKNTNYRIDCCLDHTDNYVISGSEDGTVYMWSLVEGQMICRLEHIGNKVVHSLSPHPSKPWLVTAAQSSIFLWKDQPQNDDWISRATRPSKHPHFFNRCIFDFISPRQLVRRYKNKMFFLRCSHLVLLSL